MFKQIQEALERTEHGVSSPEVEHCRVCFDDWPCSNQRALASMTFREPCETCDTTGHVDPADCASDDHVHCPDCTDGYILHPAEEVWSEMVRALRLAADYEQLTAQGYFEEYGHNDYPIAELTAILKLVKGSSDGS